VGMGVVVVTAGVGVGALLGVGVGVLLGVGVGVLLGALLVGALVAGADVAGGKGTAGTGGGLLTGEECAREEETGGIILIALAEALDLVAAGVALGDGRGLWEV
jgi:hypothetical protein